MFLELDFKYRGKLARPKFERNPRLFFYVSSEIRHPLAPVIEVGPDARHVTLRIADNTSYESVLAARINVCVFTELVNDYHQWGACQAGFAQFIVADLCADGGGRKHHTELFVPNANTRSKGTLSVQLTSRAIFEHIPAFTHSAISKRTRETLAAHRHTLLESVRTRATFSDRIAPTFPYTQGIECMSFDSSMGRVPAGLYACLRPEKTTAAQIEDYFLHVLKNCVLGRESLEYSSVKTFDDILECTDVHVLSMLLVQSAAAYVLHCPYMPDRVRLDDDTCVDTECFSIFRFANCGDCEDSAREILFQLDSILHHGHHFSHPIMKKLYTVRQMYIFSMVLAGVSSASVDFDANPNNEMGAHMFVIGVPFHTFFKRMRNIDLSTLKACPEFVSRYSASAANDACLRRLILEGTGKFMADASEDHDPRAVDYLCSDPKIKHLQGPARHMFHLAAGKNRWKECFYRILVRGFTSELQYLGTPITSFYFGTLSSNSKEFTKGCHIKAIVFPSKRDLETTFFFPLPATTADELTAFYALQSDYLPILPLLPPPSSPYIGSASSSSSEDAYTSLKQLHKPVISQKFESIASAIATHRRHTIASSSSSSSASVHRVTFSLPLQSFYNNDFQWIRDQITLVSSLPRIIGTGHHLEIPTKDSMGVTFWYDVEF
jgi:hypothetical protein